MGPVALALALLGANNVWCGCNQGAVSLLDDTIAPGAPVVFVIRSTEVMGRLVAAAEPVLVKDGVAHPLVLDRVLEIERYGWTQIALRSPETLEPGAYKLELLGLANSVAAEENAIEAAKAATHLADDYDFEAVSAELTRRPSSEELQREAAEQEVRWFMTRVQDEGARIRVLPRARVRWTRNPRQLTATWLPTDDHPEAWAMLSAPLSSGDEERVVLVEMLDEHDSARADGSIYAVVKGDRVVVGQEACFGVSRFGESQTHRVRLSVPIEPSGSYLQAIVPGYLGRLAR